jgi:MFS family permease
MTYLCFALTHSVLLFGSLFVAYGLYQGIFRTVGKAFASDLVPEHMRAGGVGWYSATVGALQLVASLVAGLLWDRVGHAAVFYYGAFFAFAGCIGVRVLIPANAGNSHHASW